MNQNQAVSGYQIARQSIALLLSIFLIPFASGSLFAQDQPPPPPGAPYPGGQYPAGQYPGAPNQGAPPPGPGAPYQPMDAYSLDQLVAPMALYPDSLVALVLTASTYPQQVGDANNWVHQTPGMPPQERANEANTMPWDPSVKALTAFPGVLDNLARNYNWSSQLGNAYYNQPADVMNAVQAARVQAYQTGALRTTPQQQVAYNGGLITIAPVNPGVVYVPYYNPWRVYGGWVTPYPAFYVPPPPPGLVVGFGAGIGIGFVAGVSLAVFAPFGWGFHAWAPNWGGGVVAFHNAPYISRSVTVINHGNFAAYNRGVFERPGRGVPANFRPAVTREAAAGFARGAVGARPSPGYARPEAARPGAPAYSRPGEAARPGAPAYSRPGEAARPGAPAYARPGEAARPAPGAREAAPNRQAAPARGQQARPAERGKGEEKEEHK